MATSVTLLQRYRNPDFFQEKNSPVYAYSINAPSVDLSAYYTKVEINATFAPLASPTFTGIVKADHITETTGSHKVVIDVDLYVTGNIISQGEIQAFGGSAPGSWWSSMPYATTTTVGGVKVDGTTITINGSGVISSIGGGTSLNGTGFVKANGTTISYDNSTYLTTTGKASDTTLLDGMASNRFIYGSNSVGFISLSGGDVNTVEKAGFYGLYATSNAPFAGDGGMISIPAWTGNAIGGSRYNFQMAGSTGGVFYTRITSDVGVGTWRRFWTDNDFSISSYATLASPTFTGGVTSVYNGGYSLKLYSAVGTNNGIIFSTPTSASQSIITDYNGTTEQALILGTWTNRTKQLVLNPNGRVGILRVPTSFEFEVAGSVYAVSGWFRTSSGTGWYNQDLGGGIFMQNSTYVEVYGDKAFKMSKPVANGNGARLYLSNNNYTNNVGAGCDIIFGHWSDTENPRRYARIYSYGETVNGTADALRFNMCPGDTAYDVMTIKYNGVGIGRTDPGVRLDVYNSTGNASAYPVARFGKGATGLSATSYDTVTIEANDVATLRLCESDGTQFTLTGGDGNATLASTHGMRFYTYGTANTVGYSGMLGTLRLALTSGGVDLYGSVTATGEITAYYSSDRFLKQNIRPLFSATSILERLNPVSFNWNSRAKELNPVKDDRVNYGLIAQEIEEILPELIHTIYDEYKSIDYVQLIPLLIQGFKEMREEIRELKNKLNSR